MKFLVYNTIQIVINYFSGVIMKIIISMPLNSYDVRETDASVFLLDIQEQTVEDFKKEFNQALVNYINGFEPLNQTMNEKNEVFLELEEDSPAYNMAMEEFLKDFEAVQEYKENNMVFEKNGSYLNLEYFLLNNQSIESFEILSLEDWVEKKTKEVQVKPQMQF